MTSINQTQKITKENLENSTFLNSKIIEASNINRENETMGCLEKLTQAYITCIYNLLKALTCSNNNDSEYFISLSESLLKDYEVLPSFNEVYCKIIFQTPDDHLMILSPYYSISDREVNEFNAECFNITFKKQTEKTFQKIIKSLTICNSYIKDNMNKYSVYENKLNLFSRTMCYCLFYLNWLKQQPEENYSDDYNKLYEVTLIKLIVLLNKIESPDKLDNLR